MRYVLYSFCFNLKGKEKNKGNVFYKHFKAFEKVNGKAVANRILAFGQSLPWLSV